MPIFTLTDVKTKFQGLIRSAIVILKLSHEHKYDISTSKEITVALVGGRHTKFMLFRCKCRKKMAFPEENFALALRYGTEETQKFLQELDKVF